MNGGPEAAASLPAELTPRRSSEPAVRAGAPARSPIEPLMAGLVGLASLLALVLSRDASAAVAVVILGGLLMHAWLAPIRRTLFIAMFLGLAADRPGDTDGHWASPIVDIGGMLFQNLNKVIGIEALKFSGVFLLLAMLLAVRAVRRLERRGGDTPASVLPATPMLASVLAALAAVVVMLVIGMLRGGNVQMAKIQLQGFLQMLAAAYLFSVSLRGPRDYRTAARVIVAAACVKAAMAVWVRFTLPPMFPDRWGVMRELEYATNHGDSLLFACAVAVLAGPLIHGPGRAALRRALIFLPIMLIGLIANDRRIGWVQVALVIIAPLAMNARTLLTRRVLRRAVMLSPLLLVYVVVGWFSPSKVFAPVQLVRGLVVQERTDGSLDRSTLYRDIENYNLVYTFRSYPVIGTGFGHPFVEPVKGDDLSTEFEEYAYLPHNSVLGVWAFAGIGGFTAIFSVVLVSLFLAARAHALAVQPQQAIAVAAAVGTIAAYVLHLYGDIGFSEAPAIFLVGLAIAVSGQMAAQTGAWPQARRRVTAESAGDMS